MMGMGRGGMIGEGREGGEILHSAGAAPVVAVVEVEAFALEDECAEAILVLVMVSVL